MSTSSISHASSQAAVIPQQNSANDSAAVFAASQPTSKVTGSNVQSRPHHHASGNASWQSALLNLQSSPRTQDPRTIPEAGTQSTNTRTA